MTERVIRKVRVLQGHGAITSAQCIRAERYVARHPEIFGDGANITVNQAARLAVDRCFMSPRGQLQAKTSVGSETAPTRCGATPDHERGSHGRVTRDSGHKRWSGTMRTLLLIAAVAVGAGRVDAVRGADRNEVDCRRADMLVALAHGEPANYLVTGELCATQAELRTGTAVQLLVHGATYNHDYWDFREIDGTRHSYARAVAANGIATFALDEIGVGGSSHPPSNLVTVDAAAYVAHQVVHALRGGDLSGTHFAKVITVGHSLGSVVVWQEAIRFADVDGAIVTGAAHFFSKRLSSALAVALHPAVQDARFMTTGLDLGYVTNLPGTRAGLFFPAFIPGDDDARKDVVPMAELATALPIMTSSITRAIHVPVLTIVGDKDVLICGENIRGDYFDCSSGTSVARQETPFYSPEAYLHACIIPGAANDLNLALYATLQVADVVAWTARFVDPRLEPGDFVSDDVRERKSPRNDGLPSNCGTASLETAQAYTATGQVHLGQGHLLAR